MNNRTKLGLISGKICITGKISASLRAQLSRPGKYLAYKVLGLIIIQ